MRDCQKLEVKGKANLLPDEIYRGALLLAPMEEKFNPTQEIRRSTHKLDPMKTSDR